MFPNADSKESILDIFYDRKKYGNIGGVMGIALLPTALYKPCKKCNSKNITFVPVNGGDKVRFYGQCDGCKSTSPMGENFWKACKKWQIENAIPE